MTVLQQPYGNREQLLTLGTIVEFEKETESKVKYKIYLLCLQPLCDSIRLTDPRLFPFLLLENVAAGKAFHILAPVNNSYLHLKIDSHAYNCSMITFPPSSGKKAVYTSSDSVFVDDKRNKYRWLGQLKWSYAQKVVNEFASQTCRVGVDQSEWIRRQNPDVRNNND